MFKKKRIEHAKDMKISYWKKTIQGTISGNKLQICNKSHIGNKKIHSKLKSMFTVRH